jgi:hypothetical protein
MHMPSGMDQAGGHPGQIEAGAKAMPHKRTPVEHLDERRAQLLEQLDAAQRGFEYHCRERDEHADWARTIELEVTALKNALRTLEVDQPQTAPAAGDF